jgi:hypothetical protein
MLGKVGVLRLVIYLGVSLLTWVGAVLPAATRASAVRDSSSLEQILDWSLSPDGLGPVRIGMTLGVVQRISGRTMVRGYGRPTCRSWTLAGIPEGLSFTTSNGRIARIDVFRGPWRTTRDLGIMSTTEQIEDEYRTRAKPHEYTNGEYLIVGGDRRLVFETSSQGRVTRFRAGRPPHVEYVEGCA